MGMLVVGVSHREAPIALRERLVVDPTALSATLEALREHTRGAVVISTCNRTELYAVTGHQRSGREALVRFMGDMSEVSATDISAVAYDHWQEQTVRHLFRVSAGLESMILGEPQILGQVRSAFESANRAGTAGPHLSRLFRHALLVGKSARTRSAISRKAVSVSYAAVELARRALGTLEGRTVLVVGAGETGELAARTLVKHGASELLVTNRTEGRAATVAERCGGQALPFEELEQACVRADILITCTASLRHILSREQVEAVMARRPERPLFVVDIAMPRDVDPSSATLAGVFLHNIDDLQAVVQTNLATRRKHAATVERLVDEEVSRFMAWWDSLEVTPTITALVERAESIRQAEVNRALSRMNGISDRDRNAVNALSVAIINKLLHEPITRLKRGSAENDVRGHVRAIHELFSLDQVTT